MYLDDIHFSIRHGDKVDSTLILTALGVDLAGNKEVLALRACAEEDKEGWACLLHDLRRRGATQIDLIVTDGHEGLLAAVSEWFSATSRQPCLVHKQRNMLSAIPRRERSEVTAELVGIWDQPDKQEAVAQLAAFKAKYGKRYQQCKGELVCREQGLFGDEDGNAARASSFFLIRGTRCARLAYILSGFLHSFTQLSLWYQPD